MYYLLVVLTATSHLSLRGKKKNDCTGNVYKQIVMFTDNGDATNFTPSLTMTTIFAWAQVFQLTKPETLLPYVQQIIKIK